MTLLTFSSAIGLWLATTCGLCFKLLPYEKNTLTGNLLVTSLIFFNNLNIFIALCEICLCKHIKLIQEHYQSLKKTYERGKEWDACIALLTYPIPMSQLFDGKIWAKMWSTYALYDPSYQDHHSAGFFIDVCNGCSTIIPCILINAAMVLPDLCSPLVVGCVAVAFYWQMLYLTLVYLFSFIYNRRYDGFPPLEIGLFVGATNGVWILFPAIGIYASVCILRDGNFNVFGL